MDANLDGKSLDIRTDKLEQLKAVFPEIFTEGKLDWERLRETLGEATASGNERYVLNWAGKADAFRAIQTPSTATLTPDRAESVNFDSSENIFIEGENLEALKILQKSYYGKVKMIYIDPPYNTGNDSFVYPDKFSESREDYLKRIGDKDAEGNLLRQGVFQKNSKDSGHYHSNWLSMMYPRLFLARNLLREDGVIFVSIDDHEAHNLRLLMNEIFGEENFIAQFVWEGALKNDSKFVSVSHDYMICFCRHKEALKLNDQLWRLRKQGIDEIFSQVETLREKHQDNFDIINAEFRHWFRSLPKNHPSFQHRHYSTIDANGVYFPGDVSWPGGGGPKYDVLHPDTKEPVRVPARGWVFPRKETMLSAIDAGRIEFGEDHTSIPKRKYYLHETEGQVLPSVIYKDRRTAQQRLDKLLGGRVFNNPKDDEVLAKLVEATTQEGDIILDFFAGSGSTAEAIIRVVQETNGVRRFILVQFPETVDQLKREQKAAHEFCVSLQRPPLISEITKERIRRSIKMADPESKWQLGFKAFAITHSNFKLWRSDGIANQATLEQQLDLLTDAAPEDGDEEAILFELMLKQGFELTAPIEKRNAKKQHYYLVDGLMAVAIRHLSPAIITDMLAASPRFVVCLDSLFGQNDALKANTQLQFKDAGIEFRSI